MLIRVLLLGIISAAHATYLHGGKSFSSRKDDSYGNYVFGYDIEDPLGATNGRFETGDAYGNKKGYYTITDIDGRVRRVDYVADEHGFRAVVHTNEPGTAASRPASAVISSPYVVQQPAVPVSTVKTVVQPVAVAPVVPVPVGSVKKVVQRPVAVDHVSQTVHEVPIVPVKGVPHPVAVDHISQTVHEVPIVPAKGVPHPVAVDHISQTVHEVPFVPAKGISHPVAVDHISQTIHDVPIESVTRIAQKPVVIDHVPQTIHEVPVGILKESRRPVKIAQTVHHPKNAFSAGIYTHQVGPAVSRARTFREAQSAHAASLRPNLYNGAYDIKYTQPIPPIVRRFRPAKVHGDPLLQTEYPGTPSIYSLQSIDSAPAFDVSPNIVPVASAYAAPTGHVKGTPFHEGGLLRHVYGSTLRKPATFRSHLL